MKDFCPPILYGADHSIFQKWPIIILGRTPKQKTLDRHTDKDNKKKHRQRQRMAQEAWFKKQ